MNKILVVDDDLVIRQVLEKALTDAGFEVEVAPDGKEGIRRFRTGEFDLVIMDIWMPEKDGLETLMEIRRNNPRAKVIAMSGAGRLGMTNPLDWARRLGAVDVLVKPFPLEELLRVVRKTIDSDSRN